MNRKLLFWLAGLLALGAAVLPFNQTSNFAGLPALGAAVRPVFYHTTNCGGNSAALTAVSTYATFARATAQYSPEHAFRITAVAPKDYDEVVQLSGARWVRRAHFLVYTAPVTAQDTSLRQVIIVCDTPYTNVPERWFGKAPPSHAAGYSDGSAGLISVKQFAALDRSSFVALNELYPAKVNKTP